MEKEKKITYRMIANYLKQSEQGIKQLKQVHPEKLKLYQHGFKRMLEQGLIKLEDFK